MHEYDLLKYRDRVMVGAIAEEPKAAMRGRFVGDHRIQIFPTKKKERRENDIGIAYKRHRSSITLTVAGTDGVVCHAMRGIIQIIISFAAVQPFRIKIWAPTPEQQRKYKKMADDARNAWITCVQPHTGSLPGITHCSCAEFRTER